MTSSTDKGFVEIRKKLRRLKSNILKIEKKFNILLGAAGVAWLHDSSLQTRQKLLTGQNQHILCSLNPKSRPEELLNPPKKFSEYG